MARLWYGGSPADFVIAQGAEIPILDEAGDPTGADGATVVLPLVATAFTAYLDAALSISEDDLLDASGNPITTVSQNTDFAERGTIPRFQCVDGHGGPIWLSADGVTGYRLEPQSDVLYGRVGVVETAVSTLETVNLQDVDVTDREDGTFLAWEEATGTNVYRAPAGTGTVTSFAGELPVAGDIPAAEALEALGLDQAADNIATLLSFGVQCIREDGPGYATPDPAALFVIYSGTVAPPVTGVAFLWVRLPSGG